MGSLMPGWDSLPHSTTIMKRSKSSLTKEEIEAYWRHKQQEMETVSKEGNGQNVSTLPSISETKLATTTTTTTAVAPDGTTTQEVVIEWPQPTASSPDWWTRSNWAYLNAPPEIVDYPRQSRHRPYVPQLDVDQSIQQVHILHVVMVLRTITCVVENPKNKSKSMT